MEPPPEHPYDPMPPPLGHLPKTGDGSYPIQHILILLASLAVPLILLLAGRRKKSMDEAVDAIYDEDSIENK